MNCYIIHLKNSKKSLHSAKNVEFYIKKFLNLDVIYSNGIDRYQVWQEYVDSQFTIFDITRFGGGFIDSEIATFFSHYNLWKKCLDLQKPIIIFEHDAIIKKQIDIQMLYNFNGDLLNLGEPSWGSIYMGNYPSYWIDKESGIHLRKICKNKHNINKPETTDIGYCHCDTMWLFGAHCYLLNPIGAKKLVEAANKGILPADIFIRQDIIDIYDYLPHPVVQESNFTLIQKKINNKNEITNEWDY